MKSSFVITAFLLVFGFLAEARAAGPTTVAYDPGGGIATQILTRDNSPYVISGGCADNTLRRGKTLAIEAGVVVKFQPPEYCNGGTRPTQILVYGDLFVKGTPADPVVFTSWHDSDAQPAAASSTSPRPQPGDWGRIQLGGTAADSQVSIEYAEFRYGGGNVSAMLVASSPAPKTLFLDHLEFASSSSYGITTYVPLAIHHSRFYGHALGAINADPAPGAVPAQTVRGENNWWGHASGPSASSNPGGRGQRFTGNVSYRPWLGQGTVPEPVIIIPGILGTELKKAGELIWPNVGRMLFDRGDDFMDVLKMKDNGDPSDSGVEPGRGIRSYEIGPKTVSDYLDSLMAEFSAAGYVENESLFVFPYDWRVDARITAQGLKDRIDDILAESGAARVDLVAHSLGGIIAKSYLYAHPDAPVDAAVFAGTPHWGAPEAAKTLLWGDDLGMRFIIPFLSPKKIGEISRTMPSVYQLLPSAAYTDRFGSYLVDETKNKTFSAAESQSWLVSQGLKKPFFDFAAALHTPEFDAFAPEGARTYSLSGCARPTVGQIIKKNSAAKKSVYAVNFVAGDGTVPVGSSDALAKAENFYVPGAAHRRLLSQAPLRRLAVDLVSGSYRPEDLPDTIRRHAAGCSLGGRLLAAAGPAIVHVYAPDGSHAGPNDAGGMDYLEDVAYASVPQSTAVFLPENNAGYTVEIAGSETGTVDLKVSEVAGSEIIKTAFYPELPVAPGITGRLAAGHSGDLVLTVGASGAAEGTTVAPSVELRGDAAADQIPPATAAALSGTPGLDGWFISAVSVRLTASDSGSGPERTFYRSSAAGAWQTYREDILILAEGTHEVQYFSVDRLGNEEPIQRLEIKIDMTPPEVLVKFTPGKAPVTYDGADALSSTTAAVGFQETTWSDAAGNKTTLAFGGGSSPAAASTTLRSVTYGHGAAVFFPENFFSLQWRDSVFEPGGIYLRFAMAGGLTFESRYSDADNETTATVTAGERDRLRVFWKGRDLPWIRLKRRFKGV